MFDTLYIFHDIMNWVRIVCVHVLVAGNYCCYCKGTLNLFSLIIAHLILVVVLFGSTKSKLKELERVVLWESVGLDLDVLPFSNRTPFILLHVIRCLFLLFFFVLFCCCCFVLLYVYWNASGNLINLLIKTS